MIYRARLEKTIGSLDQHALWLIRHVQINGVFATQMASFSEVEWKPMKNEFSLDPTPSLILPDESIPAILEAFIQAGRASPDLLSNERELKAVKDHLVDLRSLLFNELGVRA
jgi:hypothetical protein